MSSTSWVQNVNAFQANGSPAWNMYVDGTALSDWKTPFLVSDPDDVTAVPGYPTYSAAHEWEWSVVYEWSVNLGPTGTDCAGEAIYFLTGASHHSPPKSGLENDIFPPPTDPPILADWGDLPDSYGTTDAANGATHYILVNGPYLGSEIQTEPDGVPTMDASGDGDEEDGLQPIDLTDDWDAGSTQSITVEVGNAPTGAVLAAWFDWNDDGDFDDAGEYFEWPVVEGSNTLGNITVGTDFDWTMDPLSVRLRIFSSAAAAPGGTLTSADFVGIASDGEVEDYLFPVGALPVTLNALTTEARAGGRVNVRWQTATETDNVGFELLGRVKGKWQPLGEFVPSRAMSSALPQNYEMEVFLPPGLTALELVDYDTRGRPERFGPFKPGASYGEFQPIRQVDWAKPRAQREERLAERGFLQTTDSAKPSRWRKLQDNGSRLRGRGARVATAGPSNSAAVRVDAGPMTHVAVTEAGIQRVTYEMLRDGGLDLLGARDRDIAVTLRGRPVVRAR
jgi:hypothetical protein